MDIRGVVAGLAAVELCGWVTIRCRRCWSTPAPWRAADQSCVPGEGYARPHLTVTVDAEPLATGRGAAAGVPFLGPLSVAAARRIACDAELTPISLDPELVPLDVGRPTYVVSGGLRRALIARDHGCAFPGYGRPPGWCHAHHVTHWADGGPTALGNLALLCGHHHRLVHHQGWEIRPGADGHPWFRPPPLGRPRAEAAPRPHPRAGTTAAHRSMIRTAAAGFSGAVQRRGETRRVGVAVKGSSGHGWRG